MEEIEAIRSHRFDEEANNKRSIDEEVDAGTEAKKLRRDYSCLVQPAPENNQNVHNTPASTDFPIRQNHYCQFIEPDITFEVTYEGKKSLFKAHRSLLAYFDYWNTKFNSNLQDEPVIPIKEIDPDIFSRVLEWLYTGNFDWVAIPQTSDDSDKINGDIILNLAMLQQVKEVADQYGLAALAELCQKRSKWLYDLGATLKDPNPALFNSSVGFFQFRETNGFKTQASPLFNDVCFQIGKEKVFGNRVLLTARSPYFRQLFNQNPQNGSQQNPIHFDDRLIPAAFIERRIFEIQNEINQCSLTEMGAAAYESPNWEKWLTNENALSLLRMAHADQLQGIKKLCCEKILEQRGISELSDDEAALVDHLSVAFWDNTQLFDSRLSIRSLCFSPFATPDDPQQLREWFERHGNTIREINFTGCTWVADGTLMMIAELCPHLQSLQLVGCRRVTDSGLCKIAQGCPRLQALALGQNCLPDEIIRAMDIKLSDVSMVEIAKNCKELKEFVLVRSKDPARCGYNGDKVTVAGINEISKHCSQLEVLYQGDPATFDEYPDWELRVGAHIDHQFSRNCPHLRLIGINGSGANEELLMEIAKSHPLLRAFYLSDARGATNLCLKTIAKYCPELVELDLGFNGDADNIPVNYEPPFFTDKGIIEIAKQCHHLRKLNLAENEHLTEKSYEALKTYSSLEKLIRHAKT